MDFCKIRVAHREGSVSNKTRHFTDTAVDLATLTTHPLRASRLVGSHPFEERQHDRVANTVTQNFKPARRDLAIDIHNTRSLR
jgi:hypothetical protein